jgi:hypothetical protein
MTLDECDLLFAEVLSASTPPEVCYALEILFSHYEIVNIELNRGTIFWRARPSEKHPWTTVAQMGCPPIESTKSGRLNDEGAPCLYAATRKETALLEIGAQEGDIVQLVGYRAKLESPIRIAVIGELHHVHKTGYLRLTGSDPGRSINRYLNDQGIEHGRRLLYIDSFLAHVLADAEEKDNGYVRSRSVAAMIYRNRATDGVIFPSVRDVLGMNISLQPASVDAKIHAVSCMQVQVKRVRKFGFVEYEVIQEAERLLSDGTFVWVKPLPATHRRFFNLTKEEYEAAIRNADDPNTVMNVMSAYNNER